jgi:hypothetical protein
MMMPTLDRERDWATTPHAGLNASGRIRFAVQQRNVPDFVSLSSPLAFSEEMLMTDSSIASVNISNIFGWHPRQGLLRFMLFFLSLNMQPHTQYVCSDGK